MELKLENRLHAIVELCFLFRMRLLRKFSVKNCGTSSIFTSDIRRQNERRENRETMLQSRWREMVPCTRKTFVKPSRNNISDETYTHSWREFSGLQESLKNEKVEFWSKNRFSEWGGGFKWNCINLLVYYVRNAHTRNESKGTQGTKTSSNMMFFMRKTPKKWHFVWWNGQKHWCILISSMKREHFINITPWFWFFTKFMDDFDEIFPFHWWNQNTSMFLSVSSFKFHFFHVSTPWVIFSSLSTYWNGRKPRRDMSKDQILPVLKRYPYMKDHKKLAHNNSPTDCSSHSNLVTGTNC